MTVRDLMRRETPRNLFRWRLILIQKRREEWEREWKQDHRRDYFDAQIAFRLYLVEMVLRKTLGGDTSPLDRTLDKFLRPFTLGEDEKPLTEEERAELARKKEVSFRERCEMIKQVLMMRAGFDPATGRCAVRLPPGYRPRTPPPPPPAGAPPYGPGTHGFSAGGRRQ